MVSGRASLLGILLNELWYLIEFQAAVDILAVNDHGRRQTAGADAAHDFHGKTAVRGGLTGFDVELFTDGFQNDFGALDIAGGAGTNADLVPSPGNQGKECIKGGDAVDVLELYPEPIRHLNLSPLRQIAEVLLCLRQYLKQPGRLSPIGFDDFRQSFHQLSICATTLTTLHGPFLSSPEMSVNQRLVCPQL